MKWLRQLVCSTAVVACIAMASFDCGANVVSPGLSYQIFVDSSDFSPDNLENLFIAINQWESQEHMSLKVVLQREPLLPLDTPDLSANDTIYIVGRPGSFFEQGLSPCEGADVVGCTRTYPTQSSNVYLDTDIGGDDAVQLATHELGHAFGLRHIVQPSVMHWQLDGVPNLTCQDLQEFEAVRGDFSRNCDPLWTLDTVDP